MLFIILYEMQGPFESISIVLAVQYGDSTEQCKINFDFGHGGGEGKYWQLT